MKAQTVLERAYELTKPGEKAQILRELTALMLTVPSTRKTTRSYIQRAMDYIEKH